MNPDAINDGGPAFPAKVRTGRQVMPHGSNHTVEERIEVAGMSLRDYFAAKALAALIAEPPWMQGANSLVARLGPKDKADPAMNFAAAAYLLADAMLKARAA